MFAIYASSFRLGHDPEQFRALFGAGIRVAVIPNALDFANDDAWRADWLGREHADLVALGLDPQLLDLRRFFEAPDALADELAQFDGAWVVGGNVFLLRRAMKYSGFDRFIQRMRQQHGAFVYGGYSAGACVLAPSLRGLEHVDPPTQLADGYQSEIIWDGLGLLDFAIAPHFRSDHPEAVQIEALVEYFKRHHVPYRALRDGEAIVVMTAPRV